MLRLDRNRYGGSLVLYANEQGLCKKLTNDENPIASEIIVLEFYQSKRRWLILAIFKAFLNLFKLSANFETDHHKFISAIMKSSSFKAPSKRKIYRSYKNFSIDTFNDTLKINLDNTKDHNTYSAFEKTFFEILDKQAPLKTKILRCNNNSFMSKKLRENIMLRSKLKNSFKKDRQIL